MAGRTDKANGAAAKARSRRQMLTARDRAQASPRAAEAIARPAPADGGSVILGQVNSETSPTWIVNTADGDALLCLADGTGGGVFASAGTGPGLYGQSDSSVGVSGISNSSVGVYGVSSSGIGVYGVSDSDFGVVGVGFTGDAVVATSDSGDGVSATSVSGVGVSAWSDSGEGAHGTSVSGVGVHGVTLSPSSYGVLGESDMGTAVCGVTGSTGDGVAGTSTNGNGVHGRALSDDGVGVLAENSGGGIGLKVSGMTAFSRSGILTVPAGHSSAVETEIWVTSESLVLATIQGNVAGVHVQGVTLVPGIVGGSFTIHLNKAVSASTNVAWFAIN